MDNTTTTGKFGVDPIYTQTKVNTKKCLYEIYPEEIIAF